MSGIIGYLGDTPGKKTVLNGLKIMSKYGHDSCGMAFFDEKIKIFKGKDKVKKLENATKKIDSDLIIGHIGQITNGAISKINAHPHQSLDKTITLVHRGSIENALELKEKYIPDFKMNTKIDAEVIAELISYFVKEHSMIESLRKICEVVKGTYSIIILKSDNPAKLYGVKNKVPIVIGLRDDAVQICSIPKAMEVDIEKFIEVPDKTYFTADKEGIILFDIRGKKMKAPIFEMPTSNEVVKKGDYKHFMLKEIEEQPLIVRRLISTYLNEGSSKFDPLLIKEIKNARKIILVGTGTAYNALLFAKHFFEKILLVSTEVIRSSEFSYNPPLVGKGTLMIAASQTGETLNTILAISKAKKLNMKVIGITSIDVSAVARQSDYTIITHAGEEMSATTTKTFISQVTILYMIANIRNKDTTQNLTNLLVSMLDIIKNKNIIKEIANKNFKNIKNCYYLGRYIDFPIALEAGQKQRELNNFHSEGFYGGEFKFSDAPLISAETLIVGFITQTNTNQALRNKISEINVRGVKTLILSTKTLKQNTDAMSITPSTEILDPVAMSLVAQLLAYYTALSKNNDVDIPKKITRII